MRDGKINIPGAAKSRLSRALSLLHPPSCNTTPSYIEGPYPCVLFVSFKTIHPPSSYVQQGTVRVLPPSATEEQQQQHRNSFAPPFAQRERTTTTANTTTTTATSIPPPAGTGSPHTHTHTCTRIPPHYKTFNLNVKLKRNGFSSKPRENEI